MLQRSDIDPRLWQWMKHRRLRPGNCLNHFSYVLDAPGWACEDIRLVHAAVRPDAMELPKPMLHAWLELDSLVIDLTTKQRFWIQGEYYRRYGVIAETVRRYSPREVALKVGAASFKEFWGFDTDKYLVG